MELRRIEKQRSDLVQLMVVLVMLFLGVILVLAWRRSEGWEIPALALLSLGACLYVVERERKLARRHRELVDEVIRRDHEVHRLGNQLEQSRTGASELESRLKELTGLYRAIRTVNAVVDSSQTFDVVLRAALELAEGDCGSILLLDETGESLVMATCHGLGDDVRPHDRRSLDEGIAGWVVRNEEPLLLHGDLQEQENVPGLIERQTELAVSMCVPLHLRGKIKGVLCLGATPSSGREPFDDYDLRHVALFAQHAAVAIENAHLHERLDRHGLLAVVD